MRKNLPPIDLFIGKRIYQNHVIKEHIASGNNGHLFRAFDSSTGSNLAIKIVPVQNIPDDNGQQEYLNEAKKANQIEHPSVVSYINVLPYDRPEVQVKCVCFVCNYIKGKNLRSCLKTLNP